MRRTLIQGLAVLVGVGAAAMAFGVIPASAATGPAQPRVTAHHGRVVDVRNSSAPRSVPVDADLGAPIGVSVGVVTVAGANLGTILADLLGNCGCLSSSGSSGGGSDSGGSGSGGTGGGGVAIH